MGTDRPATLHRVPRRTRQPLIEPRHRTLGPLFHVRLRRPGGVQAKRVGEHAAEAEAQCARSIRTVHSAEAGVTKPCMRFGIPVSAPAIRAGGR